MKIKNTTGYEELAIKNCEKSLKLNPQNTNAAEQIKKLQEKNQKNNEITI